MLVHFFGGVWSSSCAGFALRKTVMDHAEKFEADVVETVQCNFYVDDLLKSLKTSNDAVIMYGKLTELLTLGGFHLTKWISNKRELLEEVPDSELTKELKSIDLEMNELPAERALGMQWNVEFDKFQYRIIPNNKPFTRGRILSIVSSIYDPVGLVSPVIFQTKLILQGLCRKKLGWDERIPDDELLDWKRWLTELPVLEQFGVERCIKPENFGDAKKTELHHFSDASEVG